MYPSRPGLIIGFHGCDEPVRNAIVANDTMLKASRNGYDWLGSGLYFWENNYERALDFAIHPPGNKQIRFPAVLGAVIDLQFCLDLTETKYIHLVKRSYENLRSVTSKFHMKLPENKKLPGSNDLLLRELDCAVIENLHEERKLENKKAFDSVRGMFIEGRSIYEGAGFHDKTHVQLCVRNPNCIKGLELRTEHCSVLVRNLRFARLYRDRNYNGVSQHAIMSEPTLHRLAPSDRLHRTGYPVHPGYYLPHGGSPFAGYIE